MTELLHEIQEDSRLGVMLCGHGSRDEDAVAEFAVLANHLKKRLPGSPVEFGYLEFARPVISDGLDKLRAQGVSRVLAVPGMLFAAGHAKNDIPSVLNAYAARNGIRIDYGKDLGIDPRMLKAAADRIEEALATTPGDASRHETLLVVVGRGASDPDANSNVFKVTRMLWEGFGFGWAETAYSGVTFPLVEPALEHCAKLNYRRIVVFPYFLFTGILVQRIYDAVDRVAKRYPGIEFVKAPYLNDHPEVVETFMERLQQILTGDTAMNCQACKYRAQVLGFEDEVGLAQESHHHHVEGIGTAGHEHSHAHHDHDHGHHDHHGHHHHHHDDGHHHGHDHRHHGHGHHPYPHADHPLGPRSMRKERA